MPQPSPRLGVPIYAHDWLIQIHDASAAEQVRVDRRNWTAAEGRQFYLVSFSAVNLRHGPNTISPTQVLLRDAGQVFYLPAGQGSAGAYTEDVTELGCELAGQAPLSQTLIFTPAVDLPAPALRFLARPYVDLTRRGTRPPMELPTLNVIRPSERIQPPRSKPVPSGWIAYLVPPCDLAHCEPQGGLWLVRGDGSLPRLIAPDAAHGWLKVAPGGQQVLVMVQPRVGWPQLYLSDVEGATRTALVLNADDVQADFSPINPRIVVRARWPEDGSVSIFSTDLDGYGARAIVDREEEASAQFLPDGRLLLDHRMGRLREIKLTDDTGFGGREIVVPVTRAAASPDGRLLIWSLASSARTGTLTLLDTLMGTSGSTEPVILAENVADAWAALAPDGSRALVWELAADTQTWTVFLTDLSSGERLPVAEALTHAEARFASDSRHALLYAQSTEEPAPTLSIVSSTADILRVIPRGIDGYFSPDGSQIAYTALDAAGTARLYVAQADGSRVRTLGLGTVQGWFSGSP